MIGIRLADPLCDEVLNSFIDFGNELNIRQWRRQYYGRLASTLLTFSASEEEDEAKRRACPSRIILPPCGLSIEYARQSRRPKSWKGWTDLLRERDGELQDSIKIELWRSHRGERYGSFRDTKCEVDNKGGGLFGRKVHSLSFHASDSSSGPQYRPKCTPPQPLIHLHPWSFMKMGDALPSRLYRFLNPLQTGICLR